MTISKECFDLTFFSAKPNNLPIKSNYSFLTHYRSSRPEMFRIKRVLRNLANFREKRLRLSLRLATLSKKISNTGVFW